MPFLVISGADVATGFRFDVAAAIGLLVSVAVITAFARDALGKSRVAQAAAVLLMVATVALGCAAGPIEFVGLWQAQWFLVWAASLFLADEDVQAWLGRLLVSGWLFDMLLIAGAIAAVATVPEEGGGSLGSLLTWGGVLSLANRIGALPVGAHSLWNERALRPAVAWMLMACLPAATVLGLRLVELLEVDPTSRLGAGQFLVAVALAAGVTSLRQESAIRETAWRVSAAFAGLAAISLMLPVWPARIVWIVAAAAAVVGGRRLSDALLPRRQFAPADDFLGRFETAASREWNLPRVWKFAVALPLRGASQVSRFVDGFIFEQLPAQAFRRVETATVPVRRAVPELFSRLLITALLLAGFVVLLALAFR